MKAIIPPKRDASTRLRGSPARAKVVRQVKKIGEDQWKRGNDYGKR